MRPATRPLGLVGNTPLVRVTLFEDELPDVEIYAKVESFNPGGSLKDRPVLYMLLAALEAGELDGKTILDSSSGNAGIAYAWIGKVLGVPVRLVVPDNASAERKKRILAHGGELFFTAAHDGYDEALREVRRQRRPTPTPTSSATNTATTTIGVPIKNRRPSKSGSRPTGASPISWLASARGEPSQARGAD